MKHLIACILALSTITCSALSRSEPSSETTISPIQGMPHNIKPLSQYRLVYREDLSLVSLTANETCPSNVRDIITEVPQLAAAIEKFTRAEVYDKLQKHDACWIVVGSPNSKERIVLLILDDRSNIQLPLDLFNVEKQ